MTWEEQTILKNAIKIERKSFRKQGEEKLESYFNQLKLENSKPHVQKLINDNKLTGPVDLYYYIANDKIGLKDVKNSLQPQEGLASWMRYFRFPFVRPKNPVLTQEDTSSDNSKTKNSSAIGNGPVNANGSRETL